MKNIGSTLILLGIGSFALNYFNYEFVLLMWVDLWGEMVGWAIRGAAIVIGVGLFFLGGRVDQAEPSQAEPAPRQEPSMQAPAPAPQPTAEPAGGHPDADPMKSLHNN